MAFHALRAALAAQAIDVSLETLVTCSGEAFALVWSDQRPAKELQVQRPAATLERAAALVGVRLQVGADPDPEQSIERLRRHTANGRLALASCFKDGCVGVIASVDAAGRGQAVRSDQPTPLHVDLAGGLRAGIPGEEPGVYALLDSVADSAPLAPDVRALARAMLRGPDVGIAQINDVAFGQAAITAATAAIGHEDSLRDPTTLTRLLLITEQAEFGFGCAERWFASSEGVDTRDAAALARRARSVRASAGEWAERLWDRNGQASPAALGRAVAGRKSVAFAMPEQLGDDDVPGPVVHTARGRAVIVDTRGRREALARLAKVVENAVAAFRADVASDDLKA